MNTHTHQFQPALAMLNEPPPPPPPPWVDRLRKGIWPKPVIFWIVACYLAMLIVRPWEQLVPELADIHFERIMVMFVAASVALSRGVFVKVNLQNAAMVLMLLAVWISSINAYDRELASVQATEFLGLTLSFFFIQKAVKTPYQLFFLIAFYFVATALYVFKSEWEYAFHNAARFEMGVKRLAGIDLSHGHPNTFGATMLCSLPIALFLHRAKDSVCQTWPRRPRTIFAWLMPVYGVAAVTGILLTRSRASTFGLLVFGALLVSQRKSAAAKAKWAALLASVAIVGFLLAPNDIRLRIQSTWDASIEHKEGFGGANASAAGRVEGLLAGIAIFQRFPLTGIGIGNFAHYRSQFIDGVALDAHNLPGELLGETGVLGGFGFSLFLIAMWMNSRQLLKRGRQFADATGADVYWLLGVGLFDSLVLLVYCGTSCHNLQQYQWYWYAGFILIALQFVRTELHQLDPLRSTNVEDELEAEQWELET